MENKDLVIHIGQSKNYYALSPFCYCSFKACGLKWRSLMHFWCAMYFNDSDMREVIRGLGSTDMALKVATKYGFSFDKLKSKIFLYGVQERFNQDATAKYLLLGTGSIPLVFKDKGYLGKDNLYGKILMKVRGFYG